MIVNDADVTVVDSHVTPAAARALIESVKTLTPKPITTVINTHYHFDHAHGNQAFPPSVAIIGHEFTREKLAGDPLKERTYMALAKILADNAEAVKKQVAEAKDPKARAALEQQSTALANHLRDDKETRPTPPTVTLSERMTLYRGGREIEILFLGRGHTGGDVVVFLPKERIVFTGDLLLQGPSYMGDAYLDEWSATLDRVKALEVDLIVPGHGEPFSDKRAHRRGAGLHARHLEPGRSRCGRRESRRWKRRCASTWRHHKTTLGPFASPLLPSGILAPGIEPNSVLRDLRAARRARGSGKGLGIAGSPRSAP